MKNIEKILDLGTSKEKIEMLESLSTISDLKIIQKIISKLDDNDIKVRGEAFSSLVLNKNEIADILIKNLKSGNDNIKGVVSLVLANRGDFKAILEISKLTRHNRSTIRECALGALGYLRANDAKDEISNCLLDFNLEVRKSALKAIIDIGCTLTEEKINEISARKDSELEKLLFYVKREGGPKGI